MEKIYCLCQQLWRKSPLRWLLAILLGGAIGVITGHTVIASVSGSVSVVDGDSMAPNFPSGTCIYTAPVSGPLRRGDVVLVDDGKKEYALKRIIGMPGETIQIWRGYIFINRKMLKEPYLAKHTYTLADGKTELTRFKMAGEQYFVMGDHRDCSMDSRRYGPVDRDQIITRVPPLANTLGPFFIPYTLPSDGTRTIKPL